jgi:hypothetical protein
MKTVLISLRGHQKMIVRFGISILAILALIVTVVAAAQQNSQGQYRLSRSQLALSGIASSSGSLATYSPIKRIDSNTIQLRSDDGSVYLFALTGDTIYCQGGNKVSDWSFLMRLPKKVSVTVLTTDEANMKAAIIWDHPPKISVENGQFIFTLPPVCK